jgi:selenocysteine lyase/cysteine desulfurase
VGSHDDHYRRRNAVVHNGLSVNHAGAQESIEAAKAFIGCLLGAHPKTG